LPELKPKTQVISSENKENEPFYNQENEIEDAASKQSDLPDLVIHETSFETEPEHIADEDKILPAQNEELGEGSPDKGEQNNEQIEQTSAVDEQNTDERDEHADIDESAPKDGKNVQLSDREEKKDSSKGKAVKRKRKRDSAASTNCNNMVREI
jgi:hypothetical protein